MSSEIRSGEQHSFQAAQEVRYDSEANCFILPDNRKCQVTSIGMSDGTAVEVKNNEKVIAQVKETLREALKQQPKEVAEKSWTECSIAVQPKVVTAIFTTPEKKYGVTYENPNQTKIATVAEKALPPPATESAVLHSPDVHQEALQSPATSQASSTVPVSSPGFLKKAATAIKGLFSKSVKPQPTLTAQLKGKLAETPEAVEANGLLKRIRNHNPRDLKPKELANRQPNIDKARIIREKCASKSGKIGDQIKTSEQALVASFNGANIQERREAIKEHLEARRKLLKEKIDCDNTGIANDVKELLETSQKVSPDNLSHFNINIDATVDAEIAKIETRLLGLLEGAGKYGTGSVSDAGPPTRTESSKPSVKIPNPTELLNRKLDYEKQIAASKGFRVPRPQFMIDRALRPIQARREAVLQSLDQLGKQEKELARREKSITSEEGVTQFLNDWKGIRLQIEAQENERVALDVEEALVKGTDVSPKKLGPFSTNLEEITNRKVEEKRQQLLSKIGIERPIKLDQEQEADVANVAEVFTHPDLTGVTHEVTPLPSADAPQTSKWTQAANKVKEFFSTLFSRSSGIQYAEEIEMRSLNSNLTSEAIGKMFADGVGLKETISTAIEKGNYEVVDQLTGYLVSMQRKVKEEGAGFEEFTQKRNVFNAAIAEYIRESYSEKSYQNFIKHIFGRVEHLNEEESLERFFLVAAIDTVWIEDPKIAKTSQKLITTQEKAVINSSRIATQASYDSLEKREKRFNSQLEAYFKTKWEQVKTVKEGHQLITEYMSAKEDFQMKKIQVSNDILLMTSKIKCMQLQEKMGKKIKLAIDSKISYQFASESSVKKLLADEADRLQFKLAERFAEPI